MSTLKIDFIRAVIVCWIHSISSRRCSFWKWCQRSFRHYCNTI